MSHQNVKHGLGCLGKAIQLLTDSWCSSLDCTLAEQMLLPQSRHTTRSMRCHISLLTFSYRQAQATVLAALPLLNKHGIATKRPDDYFAEMAKTDQHMQKVSFLFFIVIII